MIEMIGGVISIVIGVIMLIIGGSVINSITTGSSIGDCESQDYNGDGHTASDSNKTLADLDKATPAYDACRSTVDNGFTVLGIMSIMLIISGVVMSVRGFS